VSAILGAEIDHTGVYSYHQRNDGHRTSVSPVDLGRDNVLRLFSTLATWDTVPRCR